MQSEQSDEPAAPPRPRKRLRKGCEMIADDHDGCVICSEPICRPATLEGCGHTDFCLACILQWSETTNTCPICRARFGWVCDKSDASCRIPALLRPSPRGGSTGRLVLRKLRHKRQPPERQQPDEGSKHSLRRVGAAQRNQRPGGKLCRNDGGEDDGSGESSGDCISTPRGPKSLSRSLK